MHYDVFNGDADGIISLLQLRLSEPRKSTLITGVKRDILLLKQLSLKATDSLTVLDLSMEKNITELNSFLEQGNEVFYIDHHRSGSIPKHPNLHALINLDANMCSALIVDEYLQGQYHSWAICAAYGDNLIEKATQLAVTAGYDRAQQQQLETLGMLINYNGYATEITDLHYHPADLYRLLVNYQSPFDVIADLQSPFYELQSIYQADFDLARSITAKYQSTVLSVFELPDESWSKRISGVYSNYLANKHPNSAFAVLTKNADQTYLVSLRAPLNNKQAAGDICSHFESGGGRAAAAGINRLPEHLLSEFINLVTTTYAI